MIMSYLLININIVNGEKTKEFWLLPLAYENICNRVQSFQRN